MFSVLCFIAGVDREVIRQCPGSDRIWAVQLGMSLILSFAFVTSVTYFSLSYFLDGALVTAMAAMLVGLIVVLFDRALFQADWYDMGMLHDLSPQRSGSWLRAIPFGRLARLAIRLGISLVIALTLSLLVEVALFGPTLVAHMSRENFRENAPFRAAIAAHEKAQAAEQERLRKLVADLDARISPLALSQVKAEVPAVSPAQTERDTLKAQANDLRSQIETIEAENASLREDIRAEETGATTLGKYTGRPGCKPGTNCDIYKFRLAESERVLARKLDERAEVLAALAAAEARIAQSEDDARLHPEEIAAMQAQRDQAGVELATLIAGQDAAFETKRAQLAADGVFVPLRDDPVARVAALRQLKSDPKYGASLTALSLVIRIFVAFLELAPVIAKIFFSPPSAYALWLRENIAASQAGARARISARIEEVSAGNDKVEAALDEARALREARIRRGMAQTPAAGKAETAA